jgi:multiple sugar transport system substrate-binding protein
LEKEFHVARQHWFRPSSATRRRVLGSALLGIATSSGMLATLAACGQGSGVGGGGPQKVAEIKGKVVFYTRGGDVETRGQKEILIPTFAQVAPNVQVEHAIFSASGPDDTYITKLYAMWSSGEPPDVSGFGGNYFTYWARSMCADLNPLIARDKFDLGQFLKGLPDRFNVRGKQYGLPQLTTFGTLLFYSKKLFEEAGLKPPPVDWEDRSWTIDAALDAARKLTKSPGDSNAYYGLSFSPWMPHAGAWIWGGDAFLPEHYKNSIAPKTQIDSPESLAVHEFAQDIRWKQHYAMRKGDPSVSQPGRGTFTSGRLGMTVDGGWNFWGYSVVQDFPWAAAAIPVKVGNKNPNYNDFWIMSKVSKNPDPTWAFLKHLTSPEVQAQYSDLTGTPPTNKHAVDTWYRKYEQFMPRADLEKVTQGAIDPKRSIESPDHTFLDFSRLDAFYNKEIRDPIYNNEGAPKEIIARAKPAYDALVKEIYDQWNGKLPT